MKKIITLSICIFAFVFAKSQDMSNTEGVTNDYKQSSGDMNLELQFDPGAIFNASNTNNVLSNGVGVRFRLFTSEAIAYRLNLNINYTNLSTITQDADDVLLLDELKNKYSNMGIYLRPGIEKHFTGTKRLSPYVGAEAIVGYQNSTDKDEYQAGPDVYEIVSKNDEIEDGLTFGVAILAGADFYIAKKLYLGVELNYGLYYFSPSSSKITDSDPAINDIESKIGKSNSLTFGPSTMGVFRIGFLF